MGALTLALSSAPGLVFPVPQMSWGLQVSFGAAFLRHQPMNSQILTLLRAEFCRHKPAPGALRHCIGLRIVSPVLTMDAQRNSHRVVVKGQDSMSESLEEKISPGSWPQCVSLK